MRLDKLSRPVSTGIIILRFLFIGAFLSALISLEVLGSSTSEYVDSTIADGPDTQFITFGVSDVDYNYENIPFKVKNHRSLLRVDNGILYNDTARFNLSGHSAKVIHMLLNTGCSAQVPDNVVVGHINIYYQNATMESLNLISGINIAEWAYDREEVQKSLQHTKIKPAYSYLTDLDSSTQYYGHWFYVKIDTDPDNPLDYLELVLDPDAYQNQKSSKCAIALRAITLETCNPGQLTPVANLEPLYRYYSSIQKDHYYTTDPNEILDTYYLEGIIGYIATEPMSGTTELYRYYSSSQTDHFYTTNPSNEILDGYVSEGITGYIAIGPISGTTELLHYYSRSQTDHFYTTNPSNEILDTYDFVDVTGYIWLRDELPSLPSPKVSANVEALSIRPGETKDITFTVTNDGADSDIESYLSVSVSPGLDITAYRSSSDEMVFKNSIIGSEIWNSDGGKVGSEHELLDAYEAYSSGESNTITVTIEQTGEDAAEAGQQWIRYRAAFDTIGEGNDYVRDPTSGPEDQQGWPVYMITTTVLEDGQPSETLEGPDVKISSLSRPTTETLTPGETIGFVVDVDYDLGEKDYGELILSIDQYAGRSKEDEQVYRIDVGDLTKGTQRFMYTKTVGEDWDHLYVSATLYAAEKDDPIPAEYSAFDYVQYDVYRALVENYPKVEISGLSRPITTPLTPRETIGFVVDVDYDLGEKDYGELILSIDQYAGRSKEDEQVYRIDVGDLTKGTQRFMYTKTVGEDWDHLYVSVTLYAAEKDDPIPAEYSAFDYVQYDVYRTLVENRPPKLSNPTVSPEELWSESLVDLTYSVVYEDEDGDKPTMIWVDLGEESSWDNAFGMVLAEVYKLDGTYKARYEATVTPSQYRDILSPGLNFFYVYCNDGEDAGQIDLVNKPFIMSQSEPDDESKENPENDNTAKSTGCTRSDDVIYCDWIGGSGCAICVVDGNGNPVGGMEICIDGELIGTTIDSVHANGFLLEQDDVGWLYISEPIPQGYHRVLAREPFTSPEDVGIVLPGDEKFDELARSMLGGFLEGRGRPYFTGEPQHMTVTVSHHFILPITFPPIPVIP